MRESQNPFSISFGLPPVRYVARLEQTNDIIVDFSNNISSGHVFMITGVRGCGKTVLLSTVSSELKKADNWVVIDLNPNRDMLQALAGKLYGEKGIHQQFRDAKIDLSAFGLGVSIKGADPVTDIEAALFRMISLLEKQKRKLLITVDEATNNKNVRAFTSSFQSMLREKLPVFLLMTGLYDHINNLQNEKTLTFLYRAPKIMLGPLNLYAIKTEYQHVFDISAEMAVMMTKLTKGYSFAFQVLGYLCWKHGGTELTDDEIRSRIIPQYDQYLEEYAYEKIWSELHKPDRKLLTAMAKHEKADIPILRTELEMSPQLFYKYRKRLSMQGILSETDEDRLDFVLPRFKEYILRRELFYGE